MTLFIYDGENVIVDKVTLLEYKLGDYNLKPDRFNKLGGHYESVTKIEGLGTTKALSWKLPILFFTVVGTNDARWSKQLLESKFDLNTVFAMDRRWEFLNRDATYIWIDSKYTLNYAKYSHQSNRFMVSEVTLARYQTRGVSVFGVVDNDIYGFQDISNVKLTAIEALVLGQASSELLGRRFDHLHVPTGKISYDLDLSDRQRKFIIEGIEKRVNINSEVKSVYLNNVDN